LLPLIVIVVFAGLLLGGLLAHFFGGSANSPKAPSNGSTTVAGASPTPSAVVTPPHASPSPPSRAVPSLKKPASPTPLPSVTASAAASPKASVAPSASPSIKPKPTVSPVATARAVAAVVTATPARASATTPVPNYVAAGPDHAAGIVRSYLGALARGDRATATSYLASGLPGEAFMDSNARVVSVRPSAAGSQYRVTADVQASSGEYVITFVLQPGPGGLQIIDHYSIKTQ